MSRRKTAISKTTVRDLRSPKLRKRGLQGWRPENAPPGAFAEHLRMMRSSSGDNVGAAHEAREELYAHGDVMVS